MSSRITLTTQERDWIEDRVDSICHTDRIPNAQAELDEATQGDSLHARLMCAYMLQQFQEYYVIWHDDEAQE